MRPLSPCARVRWPQVLDDTRGASVKDALSRVWGGSRGLSAAMAYSGRNKPQVLVMSYTTFR